jgi:asparagine synthase (glutamine-hydrolysing)
LPPARRAHVEDMVGMQRYLVGMGRASRLPLIFPLMAQPVQEMCLSIPGWSWVRNGHDRAVARYAFADRLPPDVAFRRSKGRLDVFGRAVFETHRSTLQEMLMDGRLAAEGFVDRDEIARRFADRRPATSSAFFLLLELADIEAWAQGVGAVRIARS